MLLQKTFLSSNFLSVPNRTVCLPYHKINKICFHGTRHFHNLHTCCHALQNNIILVVNIENIDLIIINGHCSQAKTLLNQFYTQNILQKLGKMLKT